MHLLLNGKMDVRLFKKITHLYGGVTMIKYAIVYNNVIVTHIRGVTITIIIWIRKS